jgi:Short C-terminal domain
MSIADELEKIAGLKDRGILTEDEFNIQKSKIISNWKISLKENNIHMALDKNNMNFYLFFGFLLLIGFSYVGWKQVDEIKKQNEAESSKNQAATNASQNDNSSNQTATNTSQKAAVNETPVPFKPKNYRAVLTCEYQGGRHEIMVHCIAGRNGNDGSIVIRNSDGQKSYSLQDLLMNHSFAYQFEENIKSPFVITAQKGDDNYFNLVLHIYDSDTQANVYTGNTSERFGVISVKDE